MIKFNILWCTVTKNMEAVFLLPIPMVARVHPFISTYVVVINSYICTFWCHMTRPLLAYFPLNEVKFWKSIGKTKNWCFQRNIRSLVSVCLSWIMLHGSKNTLLSSGRPHPYLTQLTEHVKSIYDQSAASLFCVHDSAIVKYSFSNSGTYCFSQGLYDQALEDCEKALQLNEGNHKALYRKAKSLKELGRHQEAYEAVAKCSLAVPQVRCNICVFYVNLFKNVQEIHSLICLSKFDKN